MKLPRSMQYSIISNPHLVIKSEDSLLDIINKIFESSNDNNIQKEDEEFDYITFLEQIEFPSLTERKLSEFLDSFNFNAMTNALWSKFYLCFFKHFTVKEERFIGRHKINTSICDYDGDKSHSFEGILFNMMKQWGSDIEDKGIIKITSSSVSKQRAPKNVLDFSNNNLYFATVNDQNSWLKIDFINRRVRPNSYSIRTWNAPPGSSHLKSWVIEGSNTDIEWKILDEQNNVECLDNRNAENTFDMKQKIQECDSYRYIRLRQTGLNSHGLNQLFVNAFEIFGIIN